MLHPTLSLLATMPIAFILAFLIVSIAFDLDPRWSTLAAVALAAVYAALWAIGVPLPTIAPDSHVLVLLSLVGCAIIVSFAAFGPDGL